MRHPTGLPIVVNRCDRPSFVKAQTRNVSHGGLAFTSDVGIELGTTVELRIPCVQPHFEARARVVWCSPRSVGFDLGVEFLDADEAFRARMVEQVCHIENYRNDVFRREGRRLSDDEAAGEWIERYAEDFPGPNTTH
jgi:hypothetical protein